MATLSLDLSGESLHKRGYRVSEHFAGLATTPIKETLASTLLQILFSSPSSPSSPSSYTLVDPFAGSGTFLFEHALKLTKTPAQHFRTKPFLFQNLPCYRKEEMEQVKREEDSKMLDPAQVGKRVRLVGSDLEKNQFELCSSTLSKLSLFSPLIQFHNLSLSSLSSNSSLIPSPFQYIISNPPYKLSSGGKESQGLSDLYSSFLYFTKKNLSGRAVVISGAPQNVLRESKLFEGNNFKRHKTLSNGGIKCLVGVLDK